MPRLSKNQALDVAFRLLKYSWTDINFRYRGLSENEKQLVTEAEFDEILRRMRKAGYVKR